MQPPLEKSVRGDGIGLQLAVWGENKPMVVCVHGLTANCRCWDTLAGALQTDFQVIAPDLRGRGRSDKPTVGYSVEHHCRDIKAMLDDLFIMRCALVGHSLGALIALVFATRYPQYVERLVLIDGAGVLSPEQMQRVFEGIKPALDRLERVFPSYEDYTALMKKAPFLHPWTSAFDTYFRYEIENVSGGVRARVRAEHIREEVENLKQVDASAYYAHVRCPTLILRATDGMIAADDLVLPQSSVDRMVREIPDARCLDLEGTQHYSVIFQPNDRRDQALHRFLTGRMP
jgi:pimeloyl-ACP methyl ester carboxylesterase